MVHTPGGGMRVAVNRYGRPSDEELRQLAQLGVEDLLLTRWQYGDFESALPVGEVWDAALLADLRDRAGAAGLRLYGLQTLPVPLYDVLLDWDDAADHLRVVRETIRNVGAAGIPVLGYSGHPPDGFGRTGTVAVRGGATAASFDADAVDGRRDERAVPEDVLWERYGAFLDSVLPVAEEAGVTLAAHPSDPPVPEMYGIPMLLDGPDAFRRALDLVPSDRHGLKFCVGCFSQMGEDVPALIREFGTDLVYVHLRDVVGTVPAFHETFLDDPEGNQDAFAVVEALADGGFDGPILPDHVPELDGEPGWEYGGLGGYAYTIGYVRAVLEAVDRYREGPTTV